MICLEDAAHREQGPVLIALAAKNNLQTEPVGEEEWRRSGGLINTRIFTINMLNMHKSMDLLPSVSNDDAERRALAPVPHPS